MKECIFDSLIELKILLIVEDVSLHYDMTFIDDNDDSILPVFDLGVSDDRMQMSESDLILEAASELLQFVDGLDGLVLKTDGAEQGNQSAITNEYILLAGLCDPLALFDALVFVIYFFILLIWN